MIQPREILTLAVALSNAKGEAATRSAISRAYYSVFHYIGQKLDPGNYNGEFGRSNHIALQQRLLAQPMVCDPDVSAARAVFETMRLARGDADYKLDLPINPVQAILAIKRAQDVFDAK